MVRSWQKAKELGKGTTVVEKFAELIWYESNPMLPYFTFSPWARSSSRDQHSGKRSKRKKNDRSWKPRNKRKRNDWRRNKNGMKKRLRKSEPKRKRKWVTDFSAHFVHVLCLESNDYFISVIILFYAKHVQLRQTGANTSKQSMFTH